MLRPARDGDCMSIARWQAANPDWDPPGPGDWQMCISNVRVNSFDFSAHGQTGSTSGRDGSDAAPARLMYGDPPSSPTTPWQPAGSPPPGSLVAWWRSELVIGRPRGVSNGTAVMLAAGALALVGGGVFLATRKKRGTSGIARGVQVWG